MKTCARKPNGKDEWICDRCGSLWWDTHLGAGWRPLSCPEREKLALAPFAPLQFLFDRLADEFGHALAIFKSGVYPLQRALREACRCLLVVDLFSAHSPRIDDITYCYKPYFVDIFYLTSRK